MAAMVCLGSIVVGAMGTLFIVAGVLTSRYQQKVLKRSPRVLFVCNVCFVAWQGVHCVIRVEIESTDAWLRTFTFGGLLAMFCLAVGLGNSFRILLIRGGLCLATTSVLWRISESGTRSIQENAVGLPPFQNPNHFVTLILCMFPMAWLYPWPNAAFLRRCLLVLLTSAGVAVTGSRAGAVLSAMQLLGLLTCEFRYAATRASQITGLCAVLIIAICGFSIAGTEGLGRKVGAEDQWKQRREITLSGLAIYDKLPVTGAGPGMFPWVYPAAAQFDDGHRVNHVHNDVIEILCESGLVGATFALVYVSWAIVLTLRRPWAVGVPAVIVQSLVDYPWQRLGVFVYPITCLGICAGGDSPRSRLPFSCETDRRSSG